MRIPYKIRYMLAIYFDQMFFRECTSMISYFMEHFPAFFCFFCGIGLFFFPEEIQMVLFVAMVASLNFIIGWYLYLKRKVVHEYGGDTGMLFNASIRKLKKDLLGGVNNKKKAGYLRAYRLNAGAGLLISLLITYTFLFIPGLILMVR